MMECLTSLKVLLGRVRSVSHLEVGVGVRVMVGRLMCHMRAELALANAAALLASGSHGHMLITDSRSVEV